MLFVVIYGSWNAMTIHNLPSFPIETHGSHCIDRHLGSTFIRPLMISIAFYHSAMEICNRCHLAISELRGELTLHIINFFLQE